MAWKQLVVIVESLGIQTGLVKTFWPGAVAALETQGVSVVLPDLDDPALFHVRWTSRVDQFGGRIELFRVDHNLAQPPLQQAVERVIDGGFTSIKDVLWEDLPPFDQSERFLTFLQACTVLRVKRGIVHPENLSEITRGMTFNTCPKCHEAYRVMRSPGQPWAAALSPWFGHLDTMEPTHSYGTDDPFEYAHWFGHIVSNRWA